MQASRALVLILKAFDVTEPAIATASIGKRIRERCGDSVPVCIVDVLADLIVATIKYAKPTGPDQTATAT
jgi:hypothetical protein